MHQSYPDSLPFSSAQAFFAQFECAPLSSIIRRGVMYYTQLAGLVSVAGCSRWRLPPASCRVSHRHRPPLISFAWREAVAWQQREPACRTPRSGIRRAQSRSAPAASDRPTSGIGIALDLKARAYSRSKSSRLEKFFSCQFAIMIK